MKAILTILLAIATSGCVIVYAPKADRVALQTHDQTADYMPINQTIPVEPRVANEITGAAGIKGDVGSKNTVSPTTRIDGNMAVMK